jgi:hypothetical protein
MTTVRAHFRKGTRGVRRHIRASVTPRYAYGARGYYSDRGSDMVERAFRRLARETYGRGGEYSFDVDPNGEMYVSGVTPGGRDISGTSLGFEGRGIDSQSARKIAEELLRSAEENE